MLQVFSSACWFEGTAYASTIVLENEQLLISFFCKLYVNVPSNTAAEIIGIKQSLEAIVAEHSNEDISIFTNNHGITSKLNAHILYAHDSQGAYPELWEELYKLVDQFKRAHVYRYRSAKVPINPSLACSTLCTSAARHGVKG